MKIGVVGLGLIGGSLAKRFKAVVQECVIEACDTNQASLKAALESNTISKTVGSIQALSQDLDIVFVCTPISRVVEDLTAVSKHVSDTTIITDVASVKRHVDTSISGTNIVPGHPIAGTQFSGFEASDAAIMENASYILIPSEKNQDALKKLQHFLSQCEFDVVTMTAEEHDRSLAMTSHLPYFLAVALRDQADSQNIAASLKGSGFKSATRVAAMPESWGDEVLRENGDMIREQLSALQKRLDQLR